MTIEQTVEIPASRRLVLELPEETPIGTAKIAITPVSELSAEEPKGILIGEFMRRIYGEPEKKPEKKPLGPGEKWVNPILGIAKDTNLTLERWSEIQREDIEIENENDRRMWGWK
jgi:hypothetical protein